MSGLWVVRFLVLGTLVVGVVTFAPAAQGRRTVSLSLDVTFSIAGTISVTLPDGTPVGSTSGAPTVIPAGFYTVLVSGPGGCTELPLFDLEGPGEQIVTDMGGGEETNQVYNADFLPNSTYTWRTDNVNPAVVHTFMTSADIEGASPAPASSGSSGISSGTHSTAPSQNVIGTAIVPSATVPFRGTLTGTVSAAGRLTLNFKGKSVTSLTAGRYTVTGKSAMNGFVLEQVNHPAVSLTSAAFAGKRSASVDLTAGRWFVAPRLLGKKAYFIVVN